MNLVSKEPVLRDSTTCFLNPSRSLPTVDTSCICSYIEGRSLHDPYECSALSSCADFWGITSATYNIFHVNWFSSHAHIKSSLRLEDICNLHFHLCELTFWNFITETNSNNLILKLSFFFLSPE